MTEREIDALIAIHVFGWQKVKNHETAYFKADGRMDELPCYSTDIASAWTVVEAVGPKFRRFEVHRVGGEYVALIEGGDSDVDAAYIASAEADTAPMAICLAALKTVGVEVSE
jgi:hypothetical protein